MRYKAIINGEVDDFYVPSVVNGKLLTEDERNILAERLVVEKWGTDANWVVELGGIQNMRTPADIVAEGKMPTKDELRDFYDSIATPRKSDGWFGSTQHIDRGLYRVARMLKHVEPGMSVLEVGCADGGVSQHLVEAVGEDGFVSLVDISPVFVAKAETFISRRFPYAKDMVEYWVGDAAEFSTRRRYDVIVAMEILEHVPDPRRLLSNLYGLLRKNSGKIVVSVPHEVNDGLGEHIHEFNPIDVMVIIGDATGQHVPVELNLNTMFAVIDKEKHVPYVA